MKIATWNVNSLRVRLPHVLQWLEQAQPDVLALQETKVEDPIFPIDEISALGYQVIFAGQKTYNGVAIISRQAAQETTHEIPGLVDEQRRILIATIDNIRIVNLYVPNGESLVSLKYEYKLDWLNQVTQYLSQELKKYPNLVVLGDFNIAPEDRDVHDPKAWEGSVLVSDAERQALSQIIQLGFSDTFRLFEQEAGHFSWWDYRAAAYRRNMGLRIDHILTSPAMSQRCQSCIIDKVPRGWERPSDHAPVIASFE